MQGRGKHIVVAMGGLLLTSSIYAAEPSISPADLPSTVNPAYVGQNLPQSSIQRARPGMPPTLAEKPSPLSAQTDISFRLTKLTVVGATVFSNSELEHMFDNYIGKTISVADLQGMADAITRLYKKQGYVLSKAVIPAQTIKGGAVTIQVIEGYIEHATVNGKPRRARSILERYMAHLEQQKPVKVGTVERYVLLANDVPGVTAKAVIQPTPGEPAHKGTIPATPGAADLVLVTDTDIMNGYFAYDNRGTKYMGPQQYSAGANLNSLLFSGDQLGVQGLATVDFKEALFVRPYYQVPVGSNGMMLNLSGSYTETEPGFTLAPLEVIGSNTTLASVLTYPLLRSRNHNLFLTADMDSNNNDSQLFDGLVPLYSDRLRSIRVGATYDFIDRWRGMNEISTQFSQGLPLLGANPVGATNTSRPDGRSNYNKLGLNAFRIQGLPWNFSALLGTKAQYAFTGLLSAEEFTLGGIDYGRAYDPAEIVGDDGLAGKAELRYDFNSKWRWLNMLQPFTYYDIGAIWNNSTVGGQFSTASLSSAGVGVRTRLVKYFFASLEIDKPLTLKVQTEGNKDPRGFFSLVASF